MGNIGLKFIGNRVNIEDEILAVIGSQKAQALKMDVRDFDKLCQACMIKLENEEIHEINQYFTEYRDMNGQVLIIKFLQDIGLPNQTLKA